MKFLQKLKYLFSRRPEASRSFDEIRKDPGPFRYEAGGFVFDLNGDTTRFSWPSILRITAYKADLLTTDDLRLYIETNEGSLHLSEDSRAFTFLWIR